MTIAGRKSSRHARARDNSLPEAENLQNTASVTWKLLPQYFTIMRLVTFSDFCLAIFLLISARPEATWYKLSSILLRGVYRFVQMLISIVFLLPLWRSSATNVYFEWKIAGRIAAFIAALPVLFQVGYLFHCKRYVPEADITLCNPPLDVNLGDDTPVEWVFNKTRGCNSIWVWFSVDVYEVIFFMSMFFIQLLLSHEKRIFTCLAQTYRPTAMSYAIFVTIIRIFRLFGIFFNLYYNPHGGPYLCFFAGSYFIEHALFPVCAYFALLGDSRWLRGTNHRAGVVEQIIKWGHGDKLGQEIDAKEIQLLNVLAGGWCPVHKAIWHTAPVCVKVVRLTMDCSFEEITDVIKELKLLAKLNHSCIVRYLGYSLKDSFEPSPLKRRQALQKNGFIDEDLQIYIVTELMDSRNLQTLIEDRDELFSIHIAIKMALDICAGMIHLGMNNVIHCDLKSPNVLVLKDYQGQFRLKVADFGMSLIKNHREEHLQVQYNRSSALWTAPEVWANKTYSVASDVYGFAIILWEIFTRMSPFEGLGAVEIQQAVLSGERLEIPNAVPFELKNLIRQSWASDVCDRPSFADIIGTLQSLQGAYEHDPDLANRENQKYVHYQRENGFGFGSLSIEDDVSTSLGWVVSSNAGSQKMRKISQPDGMSQSLLRAEGNDIDTVQAL